MYIISKLAFPTVVMKGLLHSLLLSILLGFGCLIVLLVFWFEFSAANESIVIYAGSALSQGDSTLMAILSNISANVSSTISSTINPTIALTNVPDDVLTNLQHIQVLLSSRDAVVLHSLFILWQLSCFVSLITASALLLLRINGLLAIGLLGLNASAFILAINQLPEQLHEGHLVQVGVFLMAGALAYFLVKRVYKQFKEGIKTDKATLIAYASQSGTAKSIAVNMALSMEKSTLQPCDIQPFSQLAPKQLLEYQQLFVVASTYGDGQGPEKSQGFSQALAVCQEQLHHLNYAVLALGDSAYPKFCAFGHHISNLLADKGAKLIQPVQEIDQGDETVIGHWWSSMCEYFGWQKAAISQSWISATVVNNECVNKQQTQRLAHDIRLKVASNVCYNAGDLLEVLTPLPHNTIVKKLADLGFSGEERVQVKAQELPLSEALTQFEWTSQTARNPQALIEKLPALTPRVYSIASAPNQREIRIFVRQLVKNNGNVGFSSTALCQSFIDQTFNVAIRAHDSFALPAKGTPIIMIAAGTGIAPFMSFLAQRQNESMGECWLMFGEQYSQIDHYFQQEIHAYLAQGTLNRVDYAFSRDKEWLSTNNPRYVGDIIEQQQQSLKTWLYEKGAHIYVCGNKKGMGDSVKGVLQNILQNDYTHFESTHQLHFDLY